MACYCNCIRNLFPHTIINSSRSVICVLQLLSGVVCAVLEIAYLAQLSRVQCTWCLNNGHYYWVHYIMAGVHNKTAGHSHAALYIVAPLLEYIRVLFQIPHFCHAYSILFDSVLFLFHAATHTRITHVLQCISLHVHIPADKDILRSLPAPLLL